jgi:orotate phosphoribosyltransferase
MKLDARDIAKILLEIKAVTLNCQEPYRYVSGILSPIYTDNRLLMSFPEKRRQVIDALVEKAGELNLDFEIVAGTASAGICHAAWMSDKLDKPMVYVRKASKEHGKQKLIEGKLESGQKVLLVEDLVSTGGSSLKALDALREAGAKVDEVLAIFSYGMEKARKGFEESNAKLINLTDVKTLVEVAAEMNYIKEEEKEKVLDWIADPAGWGQKMGFD